MGFVTPSDPLLKFAAYSGLGVFLLTFVLLLVIIVLRYTIDRRQQRESVLYAVWQPVFLHAVEGLPFVAPRVHGSDRKTILLVWIHYTESLRGEARQRLRRLALELQFEGTALKLLARGNIRSRLIAIVTLGRMQCGAAWEPLVALVADPKPMLSLLAARSLLQIDAARAMPIFLDQLVRRDEWPLTRIATMLDEIPPEVLAPALLQALHDAPAEHAPRLLRLIETAHLGDTWPVLENLLRAEQAPDLIAAALKACNDPRALEAIRALVAHGSWVVRAQAAATLGRIGCAQDQKLLLSLLGDAEWWVRYRAGQALLQLPFVSRDDLHALCDRLDDRFAADMLRHVLAETTSRAAA